MINIKPEKWKTRNWMDIIVPELNGKEYFEKSQAKSGGFIARHEPETMNDNQQEDEQLYRNI